MRQIRSRSSIPIVVLTARQDRDDRISALELGADDYLTKPCDPEELVLRVKNLLARNTEQSPSGSATKTLSFDDWVIDLGARSVKRQEKEELNLSRTEFNLLVAFAQASGRVLSRGQLLDAISQQDSSPSERMIDVIVARLRGKIERDPKNPELIRTVVGVGYKFSAKVSRKQGLL